MRKRSELLVPKEQKAAHNLAGVAVLLHVRKMIGLFLS
jgi:hypothetical protein